MNGIYKIVNKVNNKVYIGLSTNIDRRLKEHRYSLRNGKHDNETLQEDFNYYGEESFEFIIIEQFNSADPDKLSELEKFYISVYKSTDSSYGYNKTVGGQLGCLGYTHTEDTKKSISINNYQNKAIEIDNIRYSSISEAIRILNLKENHRTISRRCLNSRDKWSNYRFI